MSGDTAKARAAYHKASDVCVDDFQANRAPDHAYRTTPLNGLWTHTKGGFYHDGRFATLVEVRESLRHLFQPRPYGAGTGRRCRIPEVTAAA